VNHDLGVITPNLQIKPLNYLLLKIKHIVKLRFSLLTCHLLSSLGQLFFLQIQSNKNT